ncbi:helix-turn-helix transcriptional regulator [Kribbella deserti]|uniref:Helix-turn-helix transcriptional regulator n=1 Tax=Kribbella deserti TaxID=1926257 RepID=A0ABV6QF88_9ACTN
MDWQYQDADPEHGNTGTVGDLGEALHRWRDRLSPAEVGLPVGTRRRAPGLRREELAQLAGVSVDYLVRLEQGRSSAPSPQVLGALARALRLSAAEHDHLFKLAGQAPPGPGQISVLIPTGVQRLLDQLDGAPLSVFDAAWNLVSWNTLWAALLGDPSRLTGRERNIPWVHFTGAPTRVAHTADQKAAFERSMVSQLQTAMVSYPDDSGLRSLVADLRRVSERFEQLWNQAEVGPGEGTSKTIEHPELGPLMLECTILLVPYCDLRIVAYTAPHGSETADKLKLLAVVGMQEMASGSPL